MGTTSALPGITIIIPSCNGLELLKQCLPAVLDERAAYGGQTEILIVDDGGKDGTAEKIPQLFAGVKTIKNSRNFGYARSINAAIRKSGCPLVLLLNNDMEISHPLLQPMSRLFTDKNLFAAQPNIVSGTSDKNEHYLAHFRQLPGFFIYSYSKTELKSTEPVRMDFVSGGCSMFDKEKFIFLGLFDELFSPVYFEDIDICFRAQQFNWKSLYYPETTVYHRHPGATVNGMYSSFKKQFIHKKNYFAFLLKNFIFFRSPFLYPFTLVPYALMKTFANPAFLPGFASALKAYLFNRRQHV